MGAGGEAGDGVFSILEKTGLRERAVSGIPARSSAECLSVGGCAAASVSLSALWFETSCFSAEEKAPTLHRLTRFQAHL